MDNRGFYQNIGPFAHPRGFLSEIILPPKGRNSNRPFHDSWSDNCLGKVLHQLWDYRTPRGGYGCGGPHDYFRDILGTVTGLDYEFNKLEHFLSNRQRTSATDMRSGKTSTISANDISYLDFAAKSLLELICGLKHELTVQVTVGRGGSIGAVHQTNKLVKSLETKLYDLLGKLDEFKIGCGDESCCRRCSEHTPTIARPLRSCPWKNNVSKLSDEDRRGGNVSVDYLTDDHVPISLVRSCGAHKTGFRHRKMDAIQPKRRSVKNTRNHNIYLNKNAKVPSDNGQWVNAGSITSKTNNSLQNTFVGVCNRSNNCTAANTCPSSVKRKNLIKYSCGVQNKNKEIANNVPGAYLQLAMRERAGEDGRTNNATTDHRTESHNNNRRFVKGKKKKQNYNKIPQSRNQTRVWYKRMSFYSTSSDRSTTSDDASDSSIVTLTDFTKNQNRAKQNLRRSRNKRPNKIRKDFSYTNTKHTNKEKAAKNNNIQSKRDKGSLSSDKTISINYNNNILSVNPNARGSQKNKRSIQVNKPYTPRKRTTTKPTLHSRSQKMYGNKIRKQKHNSTGVYPSKLCRYRKQRPRYNRSKVGNFVKRVGNKLSKIRIFSSKPRQNISKSRSSNSSVRKLPSGNYLKGYNRIPKRKEIELTKSSYPSRSRIRSYTTRRKANSNESGEFDVCSPSSFLTELTCSDDIHSASSIDETNSVSLDYPYFFERIPSSYEYESNCSVVPEDGCQTVSPDLPISPQSYDVCPPRINTELCNLPPSEECELTDEYEITFEKFEDPKVKYVRPKKVVRKILIEKSKSASTLSTESSSSSESVDSSLPKNKILHQHRKYIMRISEGVSRSLSEYTIVHRPRKYVRRFSARKNVSSFVPEYKNIHHKQPREYFRINRFRNWDITKRRTSPAERSEEAVHRSRHKRRGKYIRIGSEKFEEITENLIDYDSSYQPQEKENNPPTIKMTFSRGTSTEFFQPTEERPTFRPPVRDTHSRGTSTEVLPLYAKRTSTSDLIKLFKVIGTNTEQLITRDTGIDPIPLKQKTPPAVIDVKTTFTNTDQINVRTAGTQSVLESARPPLVNKATDPLFYTDQKDKTTNTIPEQKKDFMNVGTDPRPIQKIQLATKATDPIYYLGQQVKFTNTELATTAHAQTETPKRQTNVSKGTATTQVQVQDQKTSFEKVETFSRGNNPLAIHMSDKGFQFDTVEHKPDFITAFTETFNYPRVGKATQTSFTEKPKLATSVYEVQTQTEKLRHKPAPPILKERKPSILSEEVAVVEVEESSIASPSELSMHMLFEKCQEDVYKRRTKTCKPRYCDRRQRVVVCDNVKSTQMTLNSSSDCDVRSVTQKDKAPHSDLELGFKKTKHPLMSSLTSDNDQQTVGKIQNSARIRKPKLEQECGMIDLNNETNKQHPTSIENLHTESVKKSKSKLETTIYDSSYTTLTSCDWKNIAKEVKLNN